jgi:hypothetical protein
MLKDSTKQDSELNQATIEQNNVTCYVCKQKVEPGQVKQIFHSKAQKVWVCEKHVK